LEVYEYKVGIIVPSYNQGEYLEKALKSIVENMKHIPIALVIMDGGSDDDSIEIIKKYERYILHWESQKDGGQAAAVNKGVKYLGNCEYVMWLNSDDEYDNEWSVYRIVEWADKTNAGICYGKSYFIDKDSQRLGAYRTKEFHQKRLNVECYLSQPSVLVRKDIWEKEGGLDERLIMCLDYEFWIRLAKKYKFVYCDDFIGNTRMYEDTKTAKMKGRHLSEAICILQKQFGYVPMRWVSAWWLWDRGMDIKCKVLLYILRFFLMPVRKKIIGQAKSGCIYE
jgi:GT2 family glycosyltransferase